VSMLSTFYLRVKGLALKRKSTCLQGDFPTTLSLQLIFVHDLLIEYDISTPNYFVIFIIP
jgi:hypothetical protein